MKNKQTRIAGLLGMYDSAFFVSNYLYYYVLFLGHGKSKELAHISLTYSVLAPIQKYKYKKASGNDYFTSTI